MPGDSALACKVGYTLGNASGLKECKLHVKSFSQPHNYHIKSPSRYDYPLQVILVVLEWGNVRYSADGRV
jgi:hypothetical protein